MSVAERARRYRTRQRVGAVVVPVEVTWNDIVALEAAGLATWSQPDDRGALAKAVRTALNQWCDGVTRVAED
jgi:hypothetical protein